MNSEHHKKKAQRLFTGTIFLTLLFCILPIRIPAQDTGPVFVMRISGDVDPGMAAFVKRCVDTVSGQGGSTLVLEMDTFGGRVDAALDIVDTLINVSDFRTVAFVTNKAISAGALIALSCNRLFMKPNTTIGDCAPIMMSKEGPKMMGEKFQSPLRAKFRALARKNGYPEVLAEAMVTADMAVYRVEIDGKSEYMDDDHYNDLTEKQKKKITSKKTVVPKGELLTMDDVEARDLGFSTASIENVRQMMDKLDIDASEIRHIEESWSETLVRFIGGISPILLVLGLGALYTEMKAPGFGVPGITGIVLLALVFFHQYLVGMADYTELLIILIGLALLAIEIFVLPGFGIAGISGMLCIFLGMLLSFQDFVIPDPDMPWQLDLMIDNLTMIAGAFICAFIIGLVVLRYVFPKMSVVVKGPYLDATLKDFHADSDQIREIAVGNTGTVKTFLRPSGKIRIGNKVIDAVSEGEYMERGTQIVISRIDGNRVIVSRLLREDIADAQ